MFIETGGDDDPRSSGAQCFSGDKTRVGLPVSLRRSEENFLALARSVNVLSIRDEETARSLSDH